MKKRSLCLLIFATIANAQQPDSKALIARLNADLMPMRSIESSPDNPAQKHVMVQFATDISKLHPPGFVSRDLAYALTSAIAGKDLSDDNLTPLVTGILANFVSALACKAASCDLMKSVQFSTSIKQTHSALTDLGVSAWDAIAVIRLVYQAADRVARPPAASLIRPATPE
jgi:hypothetical protein